MVLTTAIDISFSVTRDKKIIIPAGSIIPPDYIFSNKVSFSYDGCGHISANWDDFVEHEKLGELESIALQEKIYNQKEYMHRGTVTSICVSVCWLILGTAITYLLIKKEAVKVLIAVHMIVVILLLLLICGSYRYIST